MALKAQQYQILKAKDTKALGTSLLIIPELDQKARGLWERDCKFPELIMRVNPKLCSVSSIGWLTVCVRRADLGRKFESYKTKII